MSRLLLVLAGVLLALLPGVASASDCYPSSAPGIEDLNTVLAKLTSTQASPTAVVKGAKKDPAGARAQLEQRVLSGEFDPSQPLPTDKWHSYTPLTDKCKKDKEAGIKALVDSGFQKLFETLAAVAKAYQDCLSANFGAWFDANFPAAEVSDLLNKPRGSLKLTQVKRADLLRELMFADAVVPGGHRQTGPTCTLNSLAMLFDHQGGKNGLQDQASITKGMRATSDGETLLGKAVDNCWTGKGDGKWGGGSWKDCVTKLLKSMGASYTVENSWGDILKTVQAGEPVLVTYYIKGSLLDAQPVPRGTAGSGYHASVLEGLFTEDGTRYVVVKNPWDGWPQIWKESDFKKSWSAGSYGIHLGHK